MSNLSAFRKKRPRVVDAFSNSARVIVDASVDSLGKDATIKRQIIVSGFLVVQGIKISQGLYFLFQIAQGELASQPSSGAAIGLEHFSYLGPFVETLWKMLEVWISPPLRNAATFLLPTSYLTSWITMDFLAVLVVYATETRYSNLEKVISTKRQFAELWILLGLLSFAIFCGFNINYCLMIQVPIILSFLSKILLGTAEDRIPFATISPSGNQIEYRSSAVSILQSKNAGNAFQGKNADFYLSGSADLRMMPFISAEFMLPERFSCLSTSQSFIELPIVIAGGGPWEVFYEIKYGGSTTQKSVKFEPEKRKSGDFSSSKNPKYQTNRRTGVIKATVPGTYNLLAMHDSSMDKRINLMGSALILDCPSAVFGSFEGRQQSAFLDVISEKHFQDTICVGDTFQVPVQVRAGRFPVHLWYKQNRRTARVTLTTPKWTIPVFANEPGETNFAIIKVMDALNNTLVYPIDAASLSSDSVLASHPPDSYTISALKKPRVFVNTAKCMKTVIPALAYDRKKKVFLDYFVDHDRPVSLKIKTDSGQVVSLENVTPGWQKFPIDGPGVYEIVEITDAVCGTWQVTNQLCKIEGVSPPTVSLSTQQLTMPCAGTTGIDIEMAFTGSAPFWIEYSFMHPDGRSSVQTVSSINSHRHQVQLRPPEPGVYSVKFLRLGDSLYEHGTAILNQSFSQFEQAIHPPSQARFLGVDREPLLMCVDSSISPKVELSGLGPWKLFYETTLDSERNSSFVELDDRVASLPAILLNKVGQWTVALSSISDAKGCSFSLLGHELSLTVLGQKPTAQFSHDLKTKVVPGQVLPVQVELTGLPPFELSYRERNEIKLLRTDKSTSFIQVRQPETLELVSIRDRVCVSSLTEKIEISSFDLPTLHIGAESSDSNDIIDLGGSCASAAMNPSGFSIEMTGMPLFQVEISVYESDQKYSWSDFENLGKPLKDVLGEPIERQVLDFGQPIGWVELYKSAKAGQYYYYHFTRISDARFTDGVSLSRRKGTLPVLLRHFIFHQPHAEFVQSNSVMTRCGFGTRQLGRTNHMESALPINLYGQPPFSLSIEIEQQYQLPWNQTLTSNENKIDFPLAPLLSTVGRHVVSLQNIKDGNGCSAILPRAESSSVRTIDVLDTVNVQPLSPSVICESSPLRFVFQGLPPFSVWASHYPISALNSKGLQHDNLIDSGSFEQKFPNAKKFVVEQNYATISVQDPGLFVMHRVCDSAACCRDIDSVEHQIRPLPRAELRGLLNDQSNQYIYEGRDLALQIKLEGEPPFSFNYIRTDPADLVENSEQGIVVTNIQSHEYTLRTNMPGHYKLLFVADKYCTFPAPFPQNQDSIGSSITFSTDLK